MRFMIAGLMAFGLCSFGAFGQGLTDLPPASAPGATNSDVTQATISTTICVSGWTKKVRPPASYTNKLKMQQMKDLGLTGSPADFEEDHRLDLGAGGNPTSPQNLWPQPRHGLWRASEKDHLEVFIQRSICSGKMTLAEGQAVMLGNWEDAYTKYFGEPTPE